MVISVSLIWPPTPPAWNFRNWVTAITVSEYIKFSFSNIWPSHSPPHIPLYSNDNSHFLVTMLLHKVQTPPTPAPHMTLPSHQLLLHTHPPLPVPDGAPFTLPGLHVALLCPKHPPQPSPPVNLGTPTPAEDCSQMSAPVWNLLLSSQEYGCHSKPFHTLGVILLIYVPEVTGPAVLFSPSKDQRDFQGQAQCLLSFQSPYCNLMLYNVFLLSYLIAVLPINVPEGRGSGSFPGLVLVPRTVPDSW